MKRNAIAAEGFTLIEMLVVVLIIVLLAGMVFRMVGAIGKSNDIAETRATIEKVSHALEEFKGIYGTYPQVPFYNGEQPVYYEFPGARTWGQDASIADDVADKIVTRKLAKLSVWGGNCTVFTFGLASFFSPRYNGTAENGPRKLCGVSNKKQEDQNGVEQWGAFNSRVGTYVGDSERDLNAVRRILPCLGGRLGPDNRVQDWGCLYSWERERHDPFGGPKDMVTNACRTLIDAWKHELHYVSMPPYESYKLWSNGPDGVSGTSDDIASGSD